MRRQSGFTVLWLILMLLIISCSEDSKNSTGPANEVEEKIEQTETGVKHTVPPATATEVTIENELSIAIPADALSSKDYPNGLAVTVDKIADESSETAVAMYVDETPLSPIYHVDAKDATFNKPVTLRVPVSNVDLPDDISLSDVQIVTWQDSLTYEYLETTLSSDGAFLEADVSHFSYFAVKMKEGVSWAGGSNFELQNPLQISMDDDKLVFGNVISDTNINVFTWLLKAVSMPRVSWINYQVEVFKDGFSNDALATMQIYRIAWYSSKLFEAKKKTDFTKMAGDLYGKNAFNVNKRKTVWTQQYDSLDGIERVIIYNEHENQTSDKETYHDFASGNAAHGFLSQVFWSAQTSSFCNAAALDDPDAEYFIRIKRAYSSGKLSSNTVTTEKFTPYDIPPSVTLKEPDATATVYSLSPGFSWSSSSVADSHVNHEIIISRYEDPVANPQITIPMGSTYSLNEGSDKLTLEDGVAYYWCVRAVTVDDGDEVAETYSDVRTFLCAGPEEYSLTGRVLEDGSGLSGVTVTITGTDVEKSTTTDSNGTYTFTDLPGITYAVTASLEGYSFEPSPLPLTLVEDTTADTITATPTEEDTYTISGIVLSTGTGLSGVTVTMGGVTATTSSDGSYSFTDVADGNYTLSYEKSGYTMSQSSVSVTVSGSDVTVDTVTANETSSGGGDPHDIEGLTFVTIPGGTFQMGDSVGDLWSDCRPVHTVTVSTFEMSIYEVTNAQYAVYLTEALASGDITISSSTVTGKTGDWSGQQYINLSGYLSSYPDNDCKIVYSEGSFSVKPGYGNWPVAWVTWYGSKAFAEYYGLDLAREAEWEYACRGGNQYKYGTADGTISTSTVNNWDTGIKHPVDVGSYPANPYGLFDMSGNLWEWCSDWYGNYSSDSVSDPTGAQTGSTRVIRGGSWYYFAYYCRSAARSGYDPDGGSNYVGFRVVRR